MSTTTSHAVVYKKYMIIKFELGGHKGRNNK